MLKGFDGYGNYATSIATPYASINARSRTFIQYQITEEGENFVEYPGFNNNGGCFVAAGFVDSGWAASFADINQTAFMGWRTEIPGDTPGGYIRSVWAFFDQIQPAGQFTFAFNFDKTISVYRGGLGLLNTPTVGTLIFTSAPIDFEFDTQLYLEVGFKIDSVDGWLIIRINNKEVVHLEGVNIQNSSFNTFSGAAIVLEGFNVFDARRVSDFYYCDDVPGPDLDMPCDTFLGEVTVLTFFPLFDGPTQFARQPDLGQSRVNVGEANMDSDATYNFSSTPGQEDHFWFGSIPQMTINLIFGVQLVGAYRKDDAGYRTVKQLLILNGTEYYGVEQTLSDTYYSYFVDLFLVNPQTGRSWGDAAVNTLQGGYRLAA